MSKQSSRFTVKFLGAIMEIVNVNAKDLSGVIRVAFVSCSVPLLVWKLPELLQVLVPLFK